MRRGKLEHLVTSGMIVGKCCRENQEENMLDELKKWLNVIQVTDALKATRD